MSEKREPKNPHLVFPTVQHLMEDTGNTEEEIMSLFSKHKEVMDWALEIGECIIEEEKRNVYYEAGEFQIPFGAKYLCQSKLPLPALQTLSVLDFLGRPTAYTVLMEFLCDAMVDEITSLDDLAQQPWISQ